MLFGIVAFVFSLDTFVFPSQYMNEKMRFSTCINEILFF